MLVGPVGTGKSAAWRVLLDALERLDGKKGYSYILDAKSVPKEQLYGRLDPTTLEWTDGGFWTKHSLFTTKGGNLIIFYFLDQLVFCLYRYVYCSAA